ncbi:MAG: hypothetical protein Q9187_005016 [Circinaria calcarea]
MVKRETVKSFTNSVSTIVLQHPSNLTTYKYERPWNRVSLDEEEVDEISQDARHNNGGKKLGQPNEMEGEGRILGRWSWKAGDKRKRVTTASERADEIQNRRIPEQITWTPDLVRRSPSRLPGHLQLYGTSICKILFQNEHHFLESRALEKPPRKSANYIFNPQPLVTN